MPSPKSRTRKHRRQPQRRVICTDSLPWLAKHAGTFGAIVTSIPDATEIGMQPEPYKAFFAEAAKRCLEAVTDDGYCVFLQTDRKHQGWMDKAHMVTTVAYDLGFRMIWHKIALRTQPGKTDIFRPTYSHMLCFSRKGAVGKPVPDVVYRGDVTYKNAFGSTAVELVIQYLKARGVREVVDPFVGSGTTLALANKYGMSATGLDIDPAQCAAARALKTM
jgi:hypothetical protein